MSPDQPGWTVRRSLYFLDQLDSRRYRSNRRRIEERLEELLKDPLVAAGAERLRHELRGLRSANALGGTRFIYRICEECRRENEQMFRPLDCCVSGETPDRTVNVLCVSEHYGGDMPDDFEFDA